MPIGRGVIVCGETLVDLVPHGSALLPVAGGGPFNTALAAAQLGAPTALLSIVSTDRFGRECTARLDAAGVDTRLLVRDDAPTSLALPDLDGAGVATYRFYWTGTTNDLQDIEIPSAPIEFDPAVVHVASLATVLWPARGAVLDWIRTRFPAVPVSFDVNARPALLPDRAEYLQRIEPWLGSCNLARASSEDLDFLYPGVPVDDVAARWFDAFPSVAIMLVTCGAEGSLTYTRGAPMPLRTPAVPVVVADTVGAGDAFTGAFLDAHYRLGMEIPVALTRASAAAAITCSRVGAAPPSAAEVAALLSEPRGTLTE